MDARTILERLDSGSIPVSLHEAEQLALYHELLLDWNTRMDLTAVTEDSEMLDKHYVDSLMPLSQPGLLPVAGSVIDVGTGAGFPGALLAIADPDKEFVLLDSTLKRLRVIDEFAASLDADNISTVHARAEEIQKDPEFKEAFDLCVSRAVASLDKLAGWCLPFIKPGGTFVAYKGGNYQEELKLADKSLRKFRGKLDRVVHVGSEADDISGHVLLVISKR